MTKKKGLGRGLSALLEDPSTDITTSSPSTDQPVAGGGPLPVRSSSPIGMVPVAQIEANPFQPRTHFSEEALLELAQSIKELGVIQPVTLRKIGYDRYQLISGERRFRASQLAGLVEVPAYVRVANDEAMLENVRKTDLPTSFRVEPTDKSVETVTSLVSYYRKRPNVYDVKAATDVIREIKGLTTFVNNGLTVFAVFLLVASSLLILNTIRTAMFARRREIEVMKLVGATNWFIRVPFMLEGLVQGLFGGVLAVGFVFLARNWIHTLMNRSRGLTLLQTFSIESGDVVLACFAVLFTAVLLSVSSSVLATRRFLDV